MEGSVGTGSNASSGQITNPNQRQQLTHPIGQLSELSKKYEEKIKTIMQTLGEVNYNSFENMKFIQKKVEDEIIDFEKTIDEECMNRIILTHQINLKLIGKLRELRYDFNQDKSNQSYDTIRNNAVNYFNQINSNLG